MNGCRVFYDVSCTRTLPGTVGISRTVRRIFGELERQGWNPTAVGFNSDGFRRVSWPETVQAESARPESRLLSSVVRRLLRQAVSAALHVPWLPVSQTWSMATAHIFDGLTRDCEHVEFQPGDLLILCDASWNYPAWLATARARAQGAKVMLMVYDLIPLSHPQFCHRLTTHIFGHWLGKMLSLADGAICISKATRDEVASWLSHQASGRKPPLGFFHLGSDIEQAPEPSERLERFFGERAACFVAVGSIEPRKNHVQLLEAFESLWAEGSTARLLIAGKPTTDCEQLLLRLRTHPERGGRLLTVFDASDGELRYAYSRCNALVFPSLAEGFGLPLVEARASGCRVIASDLAVFREFADPGVVFFDAGSTAALKAAIQKVLAQREDGQAPPTRSLSWAGSGAQFVQETSRLLAAS